MAQQVIKRDPTLKKIYKTAYITVMLLNPYGKIDEKKFIEQVRNILMPADNDKIPNPKMKIYVFRQDYIKSPHVEVTSDLLLNNPPTTIDSLNNKLQGNCKGQPELLLYYSDPTYAPRDYEMEGIKKFIIEKMVPKFSGVCLFKAYNDGTHPILWRHT